MDEITFNMWRKKFKDYEMLLKLSEAVLNKKISSKDYNILLNHFQEKEEYKYCDYLKKIHKNSK